MSKSFYKNSIFYKKYLGPVYSSKVRLTRLREIEESFLYEKYRFNLLTDKFDDLFSSEGEQRFMKDQDQIISRDIIRVIWR